MSTLYRVWSGEDEARQVSVEDVGEGRYRVTVDGRSREVRAWTHPTGVGLVEGARVLEGHVEVDDSAVYVRPRGGRGQRVHCLSERTWKLRQAMEAAGGSQKDRVTSPMAGKVVLVAVQPGDVVTKGQTLLIIEAMKMENEIRAEADATVAEVGVAAGEAIEVGKLLVRFELP
mgnify:CR=1 FL=1